MINLIRMFKDPKKLAIIKLSFFFIFFIFVFIVLKTASNESIPNAEQINKSNTYNYKYTINNIVIVGNHNEINDVFKFNKIEYKLVNNEYIDINNNVYMIDNINISYFKYENILSIINNKDYLETTIYQDKSSKTIYQMSYKEIGIISDCITNIVVYKDLNDFIIKCQFNIDDYNITLEYEKQ